jgi:hypothetical protein
MDGHRAKAWELPFVIGVALVVVVAAAAAGRFETVTGVRPAVTVDRAIDRAAFSQGANLRLEGAWRATGTELSLTSGQSGTVALPVTTDGEGRLSLFLHGHRASSFHHKVEISDDGRRYRTVLQEPSLDGLRIDLTRAAGHLKSFWLKVSVTGVAGPPSESFRLSRIKVVEVKPPLSVPNPFVALIVALTPVVALLTRRSLAGAGSVGFAVAVLCGLTMLAEASAWIKADNPLRWWELVVAGQGRDVYFFVPYALLLIRWAWQTGLTDGPTFRARSWSVWALTGVLLWAASLRLEALLEVGWGPLNPDTMTYMKLAELMTSPYDTGLREPLWIWMIAGWFALVGATPLALRLLTGVLSLCVVWAGFAFARHYTGKPIVGLLVAACLAVNPFMVTLSTRGLREEAYLLAILGLASLVLIPQRRLSVGAQAAALGIAGAAAQLLRFNSYTFLVPLLAWWVWKQPKERLAVVVLPILFIAAVSLPHLQHNARQFGDPLYSVNAHFMWSRNYEFVVLRGTGCDGCPSREEFEQNSVSGKNIGAFEYVFGMHSLGEVVRYTAKGYAEAYLWPTDLFEIQSGTKSLWLFPAYLVGLAVVLFSAQRELYVLIVLLANGVPFALSLGIDARLGIQTAPFIALMLGIGLAWLGSWAWRCGVDAGAALDAMRSGGRRLRTSTQG